MDTEMIRARLAGCQKLLIGLGEEWKWKRGDEEVHGETDLNV